MLWQEQGANLGNAMMALSTRRACQRGGHLLVFGGRAGFHGARRRSFRDIRREKAGGASWLTPPPRSQNCSRAFSSTTYGSSEPSARARSRPIATRSVCCSLSPKRKLGWAPTDLALADLDATLILGFLDHLERDRSNSVRSRNARLSAIRSFLKYAAHQDLTALATIEHSLAIPQKRHDKAVLGFLTRPEMEAIIAAPDRRSWVGQRDGALFVMLYNTGARVSEASACASATSCSTCRRWRISSARDASGAAFRFGKRRPPLSDSGCANSPRQPIQTFYSRVAPAESCRAPRHSAPGACRRSCRATASVAL